MTLMQQGSRAARVSTSASPALAAAAALLLATRLAGCAAPRPAAPAAVALPAEHVVYRCASGRTVEAAFSGDSAIVRYAGQTQRMHVAISASGARYVGDGLVWWTKGSGPGSEGTLFREEPGAAAGAVLEACTWEGTS